MGPLEAAAGAAGAAPESNDAAMYRRILVPLDGSALAEQALPYAEMLATLLGAPIHLLRVIDPMHLGTPLDALLSTDALTWSIVVENERMAARDYLERIAQSLRARQQAATTEYRQGSAADELLAAARTGDLLVMTTHGRGGAARWFLGSVAEAVARRATVPIFLVRTSETALAPPTIRRLVVPLDGSSLAEEALPTAHALATRLHVPIHLVTVIDVAGLRPLELAAASVSASQLEETLIRLFIDAESHLARGCERLGHGGVVTSTDVLRGAPGLAIVDAAQPGDVIVMTSHGRAGFSRLLLGSVAETVVRRAPVPVLLVRTTPPAG